MKIEETAAIILAGGQSSRMGTDKAKLRVGEKTLLELMTEKVRRLGITEIVVSGCSDCPPGTTFVPDMIPGRGPLSGIHAGLRQIRHRSGLVLPVDTPLIPEETLRLLIEAHGDLPITVLTFNGRPEPLAAVYDACLVQDCERILKEEKTSPRRLFDLYGYHPVPYTKDPDLLINCNTPEEFARVQAGYRSPDAF
ncbi:MAG: molybdenum cofactor guanylyltransferase [Lachnospiraceae bacterium]|nr:molybdenum cofactor guanylyltransferase [Lachnospiraceae bacterium]